MFTVYKNTYFLSSGSWSRMEVAFSYVFPLTVYFCFSSLRCILNWFRIVLCKIILKNIQFLSKGQEFQWPLVWQKNTLTEINKIINVTLCKWILAKGKYRPVERSRSVLNLLTNAYFFCFNYLIAVDLSFNLIWMIEAHSLYFSIN